MITALIDPRLISDCHYLAIMEHHHYLLHKNALIPWLIIVPESEVSELHDLEPADYQQLMLLIRSTGQFMKQYFAADKINTAAIGNIVIRLHVHVVARFKRDRCWPRVVWGNLDQSEAYTDAQVTAITISLKKALKAFPGTAS